MTYKLFAEFVAVFSATFVAGTLLCLPIYAWNWRKFFGSKLWLKVRWWIPIFTVFCLVLWLGKLAAWLVFLSLGMLALREFSRQAAQQSKFALLFILLFLISLLGLPLFFYVFPNQCIPILISICYASAISDVCAFFMGTYMGRHHLPAFINDRKSYEGVAGQVGGAVLGLAIISLLPEISFSWTLAVTIGVGSAVGDICNSIAKRNLNIKDWGNTIPGHGGVLDRFASLAFALGGGFVLALLSR